MNIVHFAYNYLVSGLSLLALPLIWCHEKRDPERRAALAQRFGYDQQCWNAGVSEVPKIWIHAVSVGEVKAALAIVHALDTAGMKTSILLTTTTMTGQQYARRQVDNRVTVRYAPVDLWRPIGRFLAAHRPDMLICMETEIWPNWIARTRLAGIKTVFLNGRISSRSIRSYTKIRPLIKPVLEQVDVFSMISETDARRIIRLGAPAHRVHINGNVKMDAPDFHRNDALVGELRRLYEVDDHTPVFIAGSIRGAEVDIILDVYMQLVKQIPDMVFIIAPRHIGKISRIAEAARKKGLEWQYRTELEKVAGGRHAPLVILNTIGELRNVYSIASVVFCGASLVPLGGQNVLEAAVWAKPVLFGPSMEDFEDARILLETSGGGICVKDGKTLADRAAHLLTHTSEARWLGSLAKKAVLANQGAAHRHARVITELLSGSTDSSDVLHGR